MTRNGKIARLNGNIREELNRRLEDGQEGAGLLDWLNGLPEVRASLQENFHGAPISKQNLSEWRQGGFREWQIRRDLLDHACQMADGVGEMERAVETDLLPSALAAVLAARYAAVLNAWDGEPDEKIEAQLRLLRGLNRDIALLQKTMQQASRQKRELEEAAAREDERENEELRTRSLNMLTSIPEREALAAVFGGGQRGQKWAQLMTAIKYDLPLSKDEAVMPPSDPTESEPVKPRPTKSKRVKPHSTEATPAEANQAEAGPAQPCPTESSQVKPKTVSQIMEEAWERVKQGQATPKAP